MKASMDANGTLVIVPETGIEAYAMKHWGKQNLTAEGFAMIIDCSNFPSMLQVTHASDCAVHNEPAYPNEPCDCGAVRDEGAEC